MGFIVVQMIRPCCRVTSFPLPSSPHLGKLPKPITELSSPKPPMRPPRQLLSAPPSPGTITTTSAHGSSGNATTTDKNSNPWGPFGNGATYGADMALALGILISGFVLGILLMLSIRFYLRRRRIARTPPAGNDDQKPEGRGDGNAGEEHPSEPPTVYSARETELAGAATECAICLTEFVEGDVLKVLPACRHGFHMECAERWLAFSSCSSRPPSRRTVEPSCPVCRASCLPPASSPGPEEP